MNSKYILYYLLLCGAVLAVPVQGQVQLSALSSVRWGNAPDQRPDGLRTIYNQLNLDYTKGGFRLGGRTQFFDASEPGRDYGEVAQRFAQYRRGRFEVTAGHFYGLVGAGLLMHAFELPGVIVEEFDRRYQITRDLDGVHLSYGWSKVDIALLRGIPVDSALPPGLEGFDRRRGRIQGGAVNIKPWRFWETGFGVVEVDDGFERQWGATLHGRLRLSRLLRHWGLEGTYADVYGEYAQRDVEFDRWFSLDRDFPRALYGAANIAGGNWGLSLEYKDYQDFLTADINDPPTLIREHDAFLLNRITHALLASDETGWQGELTYAFDGGQAFTVNYTRAARRQRSRVGDDLNLWELYVQAEAPLGTGLDAQVFVGLGKNEIFPEVEGRKTTLGTVWNWLATDTYALSVDIQYQSVDRKGAPFKEVYANIELHQGTDWAWGVLLYRSTDELASRKEYDGPIYWWGANINWQAGDRHNFNLFGGKRREGLACTAGTCYRVLGFEGVELLLINQLF
ncbi:MAG: hypothetical protein GKR89_30235 [Candidatus Latescibacteria bacterium]|nr:hypothetical protein [Candidatus Latescibacterota bacterium]